MAFLVPGESKETKEKEALQENKVKRESKAMKALRVTWEKRETEDCLVQ